MNKELLPTELQEALTEESVGTIETALKEKVELSVEAALAGQDELYAEKLETLISQIDKDHTVKMQEIVKAVDKNNASKLGNVIKKYETELNESASTFKETLVESISNYIEEYIDEAVPMTSIEEATRNNTAMTVLNNLRSTLAVDSSLMAESVKTAIVDGKNEMDELKAEIAELRKTNETLNENYNQAKSAAFLENRCAKFSGKKSAYLKKVLSDKSPRFIEENFEYTARLFDRKEKEQLEVIREEAISNRTVKADAPKTVVEEKAKPSVPANPYLEGLDLMK
jgi:L-fucose mutarotase/ribose pyranase (RbsD/FucU family)